MTADTSPAAGLLTDVLVIGGRPAGTWAAIKAAQAMRRQRTRVQRPGVRILDHTPALDLLDDGDGVVSGARVLDRASGEVRRISAGAVVLAAGGCAFQSKTLGCDVNTGDGALMAVEAGAELSGMEFSNSYAIAPKGTSLTRTACYSWATFHRARREGAPGRGQHTRPFRDRPDSAH
jgi:succinate dehydrogenase/fumarate reductase flavoprotein subunit